MQPNSFLLARHKLLLAFALLVLFSELSALLCWHEPVIVWLEHHLWVVALPFAKIVLKKMLAMKLMIFMKSLLVLCWHLSKLFLLKLFKTLGLRYGVFFSQNRWYPIRKAKVMFLRRGKQFFRRTRKFWNAYQRWQKLLILCAFFPFILLLFALGLSFNVTRKTMVKKTQESAVVRAATTATLKSRGLRAWIRRLDRKTLDRIKTIGRNKI